MVKVTGKGERKELKFKYMRELPLPGVRKMRKWMSAALGALIIACGGGGTQQEEGTGLTLPQPPQTEPQTVKVTGKVIGIPNAHYISPVTEMDDYPFRYDVALVKDDGSFEFNDLPPGEYTFIVMDLDARTVGILTDSRGEPLTLEISQDTNLTLTFSDADGDGLYEGTAEGAPLGSGRIISVLKQDIDKNGIWDYMDIVGGDMAVLNSYELYHNRHLVPEGVQWAKYRDYDVDMVAWPLFYRYWGWSLIRVLVLDAGPIVTPWWTEKTIFPYTILEPQMLFFESTERNPWATEGCPAAFGPIVVFRGPVYFIRDPDPEYEYLTTYSRYLTREPQFYFRAIRKAIKEWNKILRDELGLDGFIFYGVLPIPKINGKLYYTPDSVPPKYPVDHPAFKPIIEIYEGYPPPGYSAWAPIGGEGGGIAYLPFLKNYEYHDPNRALDLPSGWLSEVPADGAGGGAIVFIPPPEWKYEEFIELLIHEFGHILGFGHPFQQFYLDFFYGNRVLEPETPSVMNYCDRANCTPTVSEEDAKILKYIYGWAKTLEYPYILRGFEVQAYYFDNPYCNPDGEPYHDWLIELLKKEGSPIVNDIPETP